MQALMIITFYVSALTAVASTFLVVTRRNAVHALLYLIVSLLSAALVFFSLGAPFVAALEVIVYAGAIMVLFVFVVMMLNLGAQATEQEGQWLAPGIWRGPAVLSAILLIQLASVLLFGHSWTVAGEAVIGPKETAMALFGPYLLGVELASMLLLAGLVGAYHLGRSDRDESE